MNKTKILSFMLAIVFCVAAFAGCGSGVETPDSGERTTASKIEETTEVVTKEEVHPVIAKKDYNESFYFTIMTHVNQPDYYWVKESTNDAMSDAVYGRQEQVRKYLGVEINTEVNASTMSKHGLTKLSTDSSKVAVYMIPTNEEYMIAKDTYDLAVAGK